MYIVSVCHAYICVCKCSSIYVVFFNFYHMIIILLIACVLCQMIVAVYMKAVFVKVLATENDYVFHIYFVFIFCQKHIQFFYCKYYTIYMHCLYYTCCICHIFIIYFPTVHFLIAV